MKRTRLHHLVGGHVVNARSCPRDLSNEAAEEAGIRIAAELDGMSHIGLCHRTILAIVAVAG